MPWHTVCVTVDSKNEKWNVKLFIKYNMQSFLLLKCFVNVEQKWRDAAKQGSIGKAYLHSEKHWPATEDRDQHFQHGNEWDILNAQKLQNPGSYLRVSVWLKKLISITHLPNHLRDLPNTECLALGSFSIYIFYYLSLVKTQKGFKCKYFSTSILIINTTCLSTTEIKKLLTILLLSHLLCSGLVSLEWVSQWNSWLLFTFAPPANGYWITFTLLKNPMLIWTCYAYQISVIQVKIEYAFHYIRLNTT